MEDRNALFSSGLSPLFDDFGEIWFDELDAPNNHPG
jgi:hypothetical protein